jgi:hypothetical protein
VRAPEECADAALLLRVGHAVDDGAERLRQRVPELE